MIEITKEALDRTRFDLVFVQHFPVFDYLVTHYDIQYRTMIISVLSSFNAFETLPKCYGQANLISVVSKECEDIIKKYANNTYVFKNSANKSFFDEYIPRNFDLKNIAIISNHVPDDLMQVKINLSDKYNVIVLGAGSEQRLVDAKLLTSFDLVITIGRTVQQCFASGTPVYVYDYFGGPGYITQDNIQLAEDHNFSGRGFGKKDVMDLQMDILNGYENNLKNVEWLNAVASERYNFDKNFVNMLTYADNGNLNKWNKIQPFDQLEFTRIKAYTEVFPLTPYLNEHYYGISQVYFAQNNILSENNSIRWPYADGYVIERTFEVDCDYIRLDPSNKPCRCKIISVTDGENDVTSTSEPVNSVHQENDCYYFLTEDPQILINRKIKGSVTIKYQVWNLSMEEIVRFSTIVGMENENLKNSIAYKLLKKFG